jgi:hypothetical protein
MLLLKEKQIRKREKKEIVTVLSHSVPLMCADTSLHYMAQ